MCIVGQSRGPVSEDRMLGRSLGNYGVVSKIGEGGMGIVYLARHATLGRKAAIKVLRPDLSSNRDVISRFFNEARAATAVRHSGIVEVYDFGFLEDRTAYIVMEYLEGESLAARLRRGRPTIAVTLTIVRAVSRALQAAHDQGIVHRDLKPDNVFLVPEPELPSGERVKILDFGIAKLAHSVGEANHTQTGTVMGTPTYMSPEQCRGAGPVDHRADLYSLGCVVYEMLCGQPPFVADGPGVVIGRHLHIEPQPPRSHRSDIPAEVEEIVLTLLKKEPRDRYRNAADLVRAIDQLATVTPPAAAPGKPVPTELVATLPMVKEKTTLNGAASSRDVSKRKVARSSITLLAAAVTSVIAFLVVILFLARGGSDGEIGSSTTSASPAVEPSGSGSSVRPAPPPTTAPTPPATAPTPPATAPMPPLVAPGSAEAPSIKPPSPVDDSQSPPSPAHSGRSTAEITTSPNSAPPGTAPAEAREPTEPTNAPPAKPSGDMTTPPEPRRSISAPAEPSNNAAGPRGMTKPRAALRSSAAKPSAAAKVKPAAGSREAPKQTEAPDPTEFQPSNKTLTPPGTEASAAPKASDATRAADAASPPSAAKPSEPPSAPATAAPPQAPCTRAAFAAVLDAKTPSAAESENAWNRLAECKPKMRPELYNDIQRRLVMKQ
ncbi:MAG: hypothetical protein E6J91_20160 [Deltaproteobacteria bacterium]|nr:MAG: hypothetical protein E6J91_20160 [Deltaproteobacteria bacterium]